jgi:hypothetical protein
MRTHLFDASGASTQQDLRPFARTQSQLAPMFRLVLCLCIALLCDSHETVGNDHHGVICHRPSSASGRQFVYLVTSEEPVFAAGKLPDNAISYHLHRPSQQVCSCCFGLQDNNSFWQGLRAQGSSGRRSGAGAESHMRSAMRNLLWHKVADVIDDDTQYVILIDASPGLPSLRNLELFQSMLLMHSPSVGVPFHFCNMRDEHSDNTACISAVYDFTLVAIRRTALKLLLPLDEAVFPLLCHVMLRGTVMQFDIWQVRGANGQVTCAHAHSWDDANQDALVNFVSSLRSEEHALAVPFSPRIQPAIVPRSVIFRSDGIVSLPGNQSSGFSCPVQCSMAYWQLHPAFDCCPRATAAFSSASASTYDAQTAYIEISTRWNLPRRANLMGSLSDGRPSPSPYNSGENRRYRNSLLTHPLPRFRIVLNRPPVLFDASGFHQSCHHDAVNHLHIFKITLQPDKFQLIREGDKDAHVAAVLQVTVSSETWPQAMQAAGYAVFGRLENLRFDTVCNGVEATSEANLSAVSYTAPTDTDFSSGIAPWFYSPGAGWFEVSSNVTKEEPHSLRALLFNVSVAPFCDSRMFFSATATVALRAVSASGAPCLSHIEVASTHNVSFDAANETRRASFLGEDAPGDLFDDNLSSSCQRAVRSSDFSCAGPNRMWHYDEQDHTRLFDRIHKGELVNMCLLHNVCWKDGRLVLYLPPAFANLEALGLFDFPSLGIGNPWIGSDFRRFMW